MRNPILIFMLLMSLAVSGQIEGIAIEEVEVLPKFVYGTNSLYIKGNPDATFQYSILDMENNHTILTGKLLTIEPMKRTGRYTFYT